MKYRIAAVVLTAITLFAFVATPAGAKPPKPSQSCLSALDVAESLYTLSAESGTNLSDYFNAVAAAASANSAGTPANMVAFINANTAATKDLTAKTRDLTSRITPLRSTYDVLAAKCRAGR